jgi:hypothetical protein
MNIPTGLLLDCAPRRRDYFAADSSVEAMNTDTLLCSLRLQYTHGYLPEVMYIVADSLLEGHSHPVGMHAVRTFDLKANRALTLDEAIDLCDRSSAMGRFALDGLCKMWAYTKYMRTFYSEPSPEVRLRIMLKACQRSGYVLLDDVLVCVGQQKHEEVATRFMNGVRDRGEDEQVVEEQHGTQDPDRRFVWVSVGYMEKHVCQLRLKPNNLVMLAYAWRDVFGRDLVCDDLTRVRPQKTKLDKRLRIAKLQHETARLKLQLAQLGEVVTDPVTD